MAELIGGGEPEPPDTHGPSPRLTDDQMAMVRAAGTERQAAAGEVLFREGAKAYDFFAVVEGSVVIVNGYGRENRVVAVYGRNSFTGELNLLTGSAVYLT